VILLAFHGNLPYVALCAVFFFMGLTSSAIGIIGATAAKELFPNDITGTAIGTMNIFPFISGIIFQPVAGMILDRHGAVPYPPAAYLPMLYLFLAAAVVAFLSSLFVKEMFKQ
jgi:MFS family permease